MDLPFEMDRSSGLGFHILVKKPYPRIAGFKTAETISEVMFMVDNSEMPIGFTMELAQHSDILTRFAELPESRRNEIVDGARNVESRNEMRNYVESMFR